MGEFDFWMEAFGNLLFVLFLGGSPKDNPNAKEA